MLRDLPEFVQKQVLHYLKSDNFTAAKALHDAWLRHELLGPKETIHPIKTPQNSEHKGVLFAPAQETMMTDIEEANKPEE
jgi:hypothetical protein